MMLGDLLQALRMLKQMENPPKEVEDVVNFLEQSIKSSTKQNLLDLMAVGDVVGYDSLQESLLQLAGFLEKMKNKP